MLLAFLTGVPAAEPVDVTDIALDELLEVDTVGGAEGSFGYRLQQVGVSPWLHAYAVGELYGETGTAPTFDLHYFNVFVGAEIQDVVVPEVQLEYEHGGGEIQMRYGQVDIRTPSDALTFRVGKFMVPMGTYNETLYPEFLTPLPDRPLVLQEIVPVSWAEVGLQLRGGAELGKGWRLGYATYIVNGLEQRDDDPTDGVVQEAGNIRDMRDNHLDAYNGNKALGFRLGVQGPNGFSAGAATYNGRYAIEAPLGLGMYGIDISWHPGPVLLQTEFFEAVLERVSGEDRRTWGSYFLVGVEITDWLEPVAQADIIRPGLDDPSQDRERISLGVILRPYPEKARFLVVKGSGAMTTYGVGDPTYRAVGQVAVGF